MDSPAELQAEVQRLRTEIQQLREIVNALFNAVFEDAGGEFDPAVERDNSSMYN